MVVVGGETCDVIAAVHVAASVHIGPKICVPRCDVTSKTSALELGREGNVRKI
jgi:hypothetical protein